MIQVTHPLPEASVLLEFERGNEDEIQSLGKKLEKSCTKKERSLDCRNPGHAFLPATFVIKVVRWCRDA